MLPCSDDGGRVVDIHAHFAPMTGDSSLSADPYVSREGSKVTVWYRGSRVDSIIREVGDSQILLEQERAIGIGEAVLSPWVALLPQHEQPAIAEALCQRLNAAMAAAVVRDRHLSGMAAVPMIDPRRAIRVLDEALAAGLTGVEIVPTVAREFVGGSRFEEFWAAVAERQVPVFIHPSSRGLAIDALQDGYLWNAVGNPVETAVVAAQIVLSGLIERYPDLHIILAHAGGVLPAIFGRIDHAFSVRPEPKTHLSEPPSRSFSKLFYDSISHGDREFDALMAAVGPSQVLLGTDHPFDMGDYAQVEKLNAMALETSTREAMLGKTAAKLFGLAPIPES
nr:amidohydrolase family protein [Ferrimicrobium sp.]